MACPFFVPVEPWSQANDEPWPGPRRVSLGEAYRGKCALTEIDPSKQAVLCNSGYARGRCVHFPDSNSDAPDALRFSVTGAIGSRIRLVWIAERNHAPVAHGAVDCSDGVFEPEIPSAYLEQARAFLRTYRSGRSPQGIRR